jgi:hypothetical protein
MGNHSQQIVQKLWNYCNVLRDDGLSYGDYVEQLTFLLFLKMADERWQAHAVAGGASGWRDRRSRCARAWSSVETLMPSIRARCPRRLALRARSVVWLVFSAVQMRPSTPYIRRRCSKWRGGSNESIWRCSSVFDPRPPQR